jgi:hypothetical protein
MTEKTVLTSLKKCLDVVRITTSLTEKSFEDTKGITKNRSLINGRTDDSITTMEKKRDKQLFQNTHTENKRLSNIY